MALSQFANAAIRYIQVTDNYFIAAKSETFTCAYYNILCIRRQGRIGRVREFLDK